MSNKLTKEQIEALMRDKLKNGGNEEKALPLRQPPLSLLQESEEVKPKINTEPPKEGDKSEPKKDK